MKSEPKAGQTYRHWKGGLYVVVCLARDETDPDRPMVVYRSKDGQTGKGETWVRPLASWLEHAGVVPRFLLVEDVNA